MVARVADVHFTAAHAGAASDAAALVDFDADQGQTVEHAVDRAERADKAAEGPVAEDAGSRDDEHDHEFAREQDTEHSEVAAVLRIGEKGDGAFKGARRAYVFAEPGDRHVMPDPVPHGDRDNEYCKDHVLEIGERAGDAALRDLRCRDLVQQLLDQPEGAQPAADRPAQRQAEDHDDAQHIPAGAVAGAGERVLDRAKGARAGGAGT